MKTHPQEKYLNLKTLKHEHFTFIGNHLYERTDGTTLTVMQLRREYQYISTWKGTTNQHESWSHNPATGFHVRRAKC
jgi:hypothetical protein